MSRATAPHPAAFIFPFLYGAVCGVVLLALILWATVGIAKGAPVPPPPKHLTDEMLVGTWSLVWGTSEGGTLWVHDDKTYAEVLPGHGDVVFHGTWWLDRGTLVMSEYRFNPDTGTNSGPLTYRLELDAKRFPHLAGTANGCTRVVMSNRR